MKTIYRDIVSALIFSKDRKLLMGKKNPSKGGVYIDCWHIPGGGIEKGENKIDALKREVLEEVGVSISDYPITLIDNIGKGISQKKDKISGEIMEVHMKFNVYEVIIADKNCSEIKVSLNDDLHEYRWFDMSELTSVKLTPPSIELFKRVGYLK